MCAMTHAAAQIGSECSHWLDRMSRSHSSIFVMALVLLHLSCIEAYAPIFGEFPGLEKLISRAEAIAVVRIKRRPGFVSPAMGYGDYKILVEKNLKGSLPEGKCITAALRTLAYGDTWGDPFRYNSRHIVFFERQSHPASQASWWSLNCVGSHLGVSSWENLERFDRTSLEESIRPFVRAYGPNEPLPLPSPWAGLLGLLGAVLIKLKRSRSPLFNKQFLLWLVLGFVSGTLVYASVLTVYSRDLGVLASAWLFIGTVLLVVTGLTVYLGMMIGFPIWIVKRLFRSRVGATSRWRLMKQFILVLALVMLLDGIKSFVVARSDVSRDVSGYGKVHLNLSGLYFDGLWQVQFTMETSGARRVFHYGVLPLLPLVNDMTSVEM